jgi:hypothetical protein
MTKSPYAHIYQALANGERIERRYLSADKLWHQMQEQEVVSQIGNGVPPDRFRIKPKTITINGHEVPEPMRVAPEYGKEYWIASLTSPMLVTVSQWDSTQSDSSWFSRGICHSTKEAAEAHAKALLSFTKVD